MKREKRGGRREGRKEGGREEGRKERREERKEERGKQEQVKRGYQLTPEGGVAQLTASEGYVRSHCSAA